MGKKKRKKRGDNNKQTVERVYTPRSTNLNLKYVSVTNDSSSIISSMISKDDRLTRRLQREAELLAKQREEERAAEIKRKASEICADAKKRLPPEMYEMFSKIVATKTPAEIVETWERYSRLANAIMKEWEELEDFKF